MKFVRPYLWYHSLPIYMLERIVFQIMENYYEFEHPRISKRSVEAAADHHATLENHPHVHWVEQQVAKTRVKRDYPAAKEQEEVARSKRDVSFNDPKWPKMWYLVSTRLFTCEKMKIIIHTGELFS